MRNMALIAAAALAASGCSGGADRAKAEAGVVQFHQMVAAERYREIYANAADEFRRSASEEEGIRFLRMIHDRLGAVRSTSPNGWRVNYTPGGSTVTLNYNTQFASGAGTEDFVFRTGGPNAQLVGYHVNSPALIGRAAPAPAAASKPTTEPAPAAPVTAVSTEPPKPPEPEPAGGE